MLDEIKAVLEELAADETVPFEGVWYGICPVAQLDTWNVIVFDRTLSRVPANQSMSDRYEIHIVHENYIPEGYPVTVIQALRSALKLNVDGDITYEYLFKGNTGIVVETCTIPMRKSRKEKV